MNQDYLIPLSIPNLDQKDFEEVKKCFDSSWISSKSPWVTQFEKLFAKKISQTRYAVAVNSGTSALFLTLKAFNIKEGDEVIIPSFTMIATVNAITWVGAKPVLVDCQSKNDWNMDIDQIEKKITSKTKAIIPVHIYGYVSNIDSLVKIAKKHRLAVIEDAAEAMGATYNKKNAGSFGDASCFSLYTNKIITTGNGGIVATNSKHTYELIKKLAFFDFNNKVHFKHNLVGYNMVLSGLQAALGCAQLKKFNKLLKKRQLNYNWYKKYLINNKSIRFIAPNKKNKPNYWFPAIIPKDMRAKNKIISTLNKKKIETRNFFMPVNIQPVYKHMFLHQSYPVAEYFFKYGILLPSYNELSEDQVKKISELINISCS